ncbi:HAD family hydrolase [Natronosalvus vescus]|uniref:HAD family hydrolase n=1 Tax=Natronosalvus vescus TaxID=2953881 RepID=UPI0020917011|nr:HAD family hydrolase [Natronosalvus vescus]
MTVDTVLFDFDDTFYPYQPCNEAGKAAARATARERGYEFDAEAFEAFYQSGRRDVKRDLEGSAAGHHRLLYFKRALERLTGSPQPADALALSEAYWEGYLEEMTLFSGVEETLATLREAGITIAIVTNLTTRIQLRKIEHLGLADDIDLLLTSEEVGQDKPASVMFTLALARVGCQPADALMVGDSVSADIVGANALDIETVLFNAGDVDEASLTGYREPDHQIDTFADLTRLVR